MKPPNRWAVAIAALAAALLASSCASTASSHSSASSSSGGVATFALPPGEVANYISPFASGSVSNNIDFLQFSPLLYRPLYWFGNGASPGINYGQSIGEPPVFSNGGRTVTVTLKKSFTWSDGQPVTARDVQLWMNIFYAERQNYLGYSVGSIPDDLTSMSFPASTPETFSLTFNQAYGQNWLLYNQLSEIVPLPQQTWDRTSPTTPIGNYDLTTSGAKAVYGFINSQSSNEATYASNPLWKVVDGPWLLSAFSAATGEATFVPNKHYTGPDRPKIAKFEELPFTSTAAEFDALRAGSLDYGYLPTEDLAQESYFKSRGYTIAAWPDFGFNDFFLNFTNPSVGPIFSQLYIRQAMQDLINQPQISKDIWKGQAYPDYGPIMDTPPNPYATKYVSNNPYPYNPSTAKALLQGHGWQVKPNGIDVCTRPGTGAADCGSGISAGAQLEFTELAATGSAPFTAEVEDMQSSWAAVGIRVNIKQQSEGSIFADLQPCANGDEGCQWQMANFGEPGATPTYSPEYLPIGTQWFATGGGTNPQGYSSQHMDALIATAERSGSVASIQAINNYAAQQLPGLFEPNYAYQLSVISPKLHGALPQDPNLNIYPQKWSLG